MAKSIGSRSTIAIEARLRDGFAFNFGRSIVNIMSFYLNENDKVKLHKWREEHDSGCFIQYKGAIGGGLTYCFTPTSIGTVIKVKCACGEEIDLTNYDW